MQCYTLCCFMVLFIISFKNAGLRRQQLILSWPLSVNEVVFQQEKSSVAGNSSKSSSCQYLLVPLFCLFSIFFLIRLNMPCSEIMLVQVDWFDCWTHRPWRPQELVTVSTSWIPQKYWLVVSLHLHVLWQYRILLNGVQSSVGLAKPR